MKASIARASKNEIRNKTELVSVWNGQDLFNVAAVRANKSDIEDFFRTVKPNVAIIDEVCSDAVVKEVAKIMKVTLSTGDLHYDFSDFVQNDTLRRAAFEVAIIS